MSHPTVRPSATDTWRRERGRVRGENHTATQRARFSARAHRIAVRVADLDGHARAARAGAGAERGPVAAAAVAAAPVGGEVAAAARARFEHDRARVDVVRALGDGAHLSDGARWGA